MSETVLLKENIYLYGTIRFNEIEENFFGSVLDVFDELFPPYLNPNVILYVYGDISLINLSNLICKVFIIGEFSKNYSHVNDITVISKNELPININNVGIYIKNLFGEKDYFNLLKKEHEFQTLTESNKETNAFRKGIYLTNVERIYENSDDLQFNLLRCSSNLDGPTDNFRDTDNEIINKVNGLAKSFFKNPAELNHVLAQIYENKKDENKKAKIKEHSDKTKDMPVNGLMAFCTFYDNDELKISEKSGHAFKGVTLLTRLRFRLKDCVNNSTLVKQFDIILYPNSVFMMPLSTNRLYTHEILPSTMPANKLPTRMGYVIRCSKTKAVYSNGNVFIKTDSNPIIDGSNTIKLVEPYTNGISKLKKLYYDENTTADIIDYGVFNFSLNKGDYMKPLL